LVGVDPKTVRRERVPDNPEVRVRMREVAAERRRFGYRRIGLMLEREGVVMNHEVAAAALSRGGPRGEATPRTEARHGDARAAARPRRAR
jgi:hypothetical protein